MRTRNALGRGGARRRGRAGLAIACSLLGVLLLGSLVGGVGAQGATEEATVRLVHGAPDAGALDFSVDDGLAIVGADFGSVSDPIVVSAGEHRLALTTSGAGADAAVVEGTVALAAGSAYLAVAAGTAEAVRFFLYEIDQAVIAEGNARVRVINASPDAGPLDVAIAGGDLLLPTVDFPNATDDADVEAADYDLEFRDATLDQVVLDAPAVTLTAGVVTDLVVVGQVGNDSLRLVLVETPAEQAPASGIEATLVGGDCADPGDILAEIGEMAIPRGDEIGAGGVDTLATTSGRLPIPFDEVVGQDAVVTVRTSGADALLACGVVGGRLNGDGALVIGLDDQREGGLAGVAVLAPGVVDPATTEVTVYSAVAERAAADADNAGEVDRESESAGVIAAESEPSADEPEEPVATPDA